MNVGRRSDSRFALAQGLDLCGVANIERFAGAPPRMHPAAIFPEARSVIVVGKRIVRGGWRGIEEGTYWPSYTYFDYHGLLNAQFIQVPLYELACFIEDHGWEAVPYYAGVPEAQAPICPAARRSGRPQCTPGHPHRRCRRRTGRDRLVQSLFERKSLARACACTASSTDLELEPDPLLEPAASARADELCGRLSRRQSARCREGKTVQIHIEDHTYTWADVDMGKCTLMYHGGDPRMSPFLHTSFPGLKFDITEQTMSEEEAYKMVWPLSTGRWRATEEFPSGYTVEGHAMLSCGATPAATVLKAPAAACVAASITWRSMATSNRPSTAVPSSNAPAGCSPPAASVQQPSEDTERAATGEIISHKRAQEKAAMGICEGNRYQRVILSCRERHLLNPLLLNLLLNLSTSLHFEP